MGQISRATFEAVANAQQNLRVHIDELIRENRPLRDEKEREKFLRELNFSTLGTGVDQFVTLYHPDGVLIRSDCETFCRWLSYVDTSNPVVPHILGVFDPEEVEKHVPISKLWEVLRMNLFSIFPVALKLSCQMSREQSESGKTQGFKVDG